MSPEQRLTILETTVSFLANQIKFPTEENLSAVRVEIFEELNDINNLLKHLSNTIQFYNNTFKTIAKERNINV
jgi:hypothetical protein